MEINVIEVENEYENDHEEIKRDDFNRTPDNFHEENKEELLILLLIE